MDNDAKLENSIKTFASEAGRFKLKDLSNILNVNEEKIWDIIVKLLSTGKIDGEFAHNNSEFVTKAKLKQEVLTILDNPNILESNKIQNGKDLIFSTFSGIKKCSKCNTTIKNEGKFCPNCGEPLG